MANTFLSAVAKGVGTTPVALLTGASASQNTIIGLSIANTTANPITASAYIARSGTNYYLISTATVPVGGTLVVVGAEQKVVLIANDVLFVVTSTLNSADAIASYLQIT